MDKKRVSFSQYSMWAQCPWRWKLKYVDGNAAIEQSIHTIFGTAIHRVLQDWLETKESCSELYFKTIDLSENFKNILMEEAKPHIKIINEDGSTSFLFSREELEKFYNQGIEIINAMQKNYKTFFPTNTTKLYAIEHELNIDLNEDVFFIGFIDIVTYDSETEEYTLFDLKTSSKGWNKYAKSDTKKTDQLLLYKKLFAQQQNVAIDKIKISYIILKRELYEATYKIPRVSPFEPANGTTSMKRSWNDFTKFLDTAFNGREYNPNQRAIVTDSNCKFCSFKSICEPYKQENSRQCLVTL